MAPKQSKKLAPRIERFVREYLADFNATRAAIAAGYSSKTASSQAYDLLRKPEVQRAIANHQAKAGEKYEAKKDRTIRELARVAFADPRDVMSWGPEGVKIFPSSVIPEDAARSVCEVSSDETVDADGNRRVKLKVKFFDKLKALELLGRHLALFNDTLKVEGVPAIRIHRADGTVAEMTMNPSARKEDA